MLTVTAAAAAGNTPPTVSLAASATSVTVGDPRRTLTATAADADGIAKVEFYNGTTLVSTDTTSPYTYTFTPGGGRARFTHDGARPTTRSDALTHLERRHDHRDGARRRRRCRGSR